MKNTFTRLIETDGEFAIWTDGFRLTANYFVANGSLDLFDQDGSPTPVALCLAYAWEARGIAGDWA